MEEKNRFTVKEVQQKTYKRRDAWWTVLLVDPVASRLVVPVANHTGITPNQISLAAFLLGGVAAGFFFLGDPVSLLAGAFLYHLSFLLDCMDGKIARLKGTGSVFGMWLDYMLDRFRVVTCALALMGGQFVLTGQLFYLGLAILIIFLDMLRYMDALQFYKLRQEMKKKIRQAKRNARQAYQQPFDEEDDDTVKTPPSATPVINMDLNAAFKKRFGWYLKIRDRLERARIRPHLFSGIEYQMFIFIIAPITGWIPQITLAASLLLFLFEAALIYKMWLSTRDLHHHLKEIEESAKSETPLQRLA
ncbi:CDP-alcohol phosphatidyltransferase [Melghirimyces thermohalophilus]|uniref:CDP-alcohol phosphatidyltransferase n=1 Tax=Melghirimyces thermohalophilus TaxID=1236220 RepID=A0A1G6I6S6_9BACL|nr:CDP-alcohol phosphatidyltransferase family protein [Melghirimyces thermohalophilus]SDC02128.1 CDP-alcohol phosphatidyltransferase [Melghirimyces thermohalophilus]